MRFSLRTLLIVMLLAGPLGAWGWKEWRAYQARREYEKLHSEIQWKSVGGGVGTVSQVGAKFQTSAADEIWQEQRDNISWESFPESQPPSP